MRGPGANSARNFDTGGIGESGYRSALVETARIVDVNISNYTVTAVSEHGNKRFFDIQVMSPYFHFANGEGWYAMPEVGAMCWVCTESPGLFARRFILGYQAPYDMRKVEGEGVEAGTFRANRQTLNPGDQMWRGRDENFVILRRGGVVQIGAGPANQRMYIPIGSIIRDFCFGYELETLAGDMKFSNDSVRVQGTSLDQVSDASKVKTRVRIRAKTRANEPGHAVTLTLGSHEDNEDLRLSLQVGESGEDGAPIVANLEITKEGTVTWTMEGSLQLAAKGAMSLSAVDDLAIDTSDGALTLQAKKDISIRSETGAMELQAAGELSAAGENMRLAGSTISLEGRVAVGGPGGEPIPKGRALVLVLQQLIKGLTDPSAPFAPVYAPGTPILFPGMAALLPTLESILSTENTTT